MVGFYDRRKHPDKHSIIELISSYTDSSIEVVTTILTASFNATKEFCNSHGLIINSAKTQFIIFKAVGKRIPQDYHLIG